MRLSLDTTCQLCSSAVSPLLLGATPSGGLQLDTQLSSRQAMSVGGSASRVGSRSPTGMAEGQQAPATAVGGPGAINGTKYRLIADGDVQVCRLNHTRTIVSKIMNSRYLRRWEHHHIALGQTGIYSTTVWLLSRHLIIYF
jgi:hypothetical protein